MTIWTSLPSAFAVAMPSVEEEPVPALVRREKRSIVPSGDQLGSKALKFVVALPVFSGIFTKWVPSRWTV